MSSSETEDVRRTTWVRRTSLVHPIKDTMLLKMLTGSLVREQPVHLVLLILFSLFLIFSAWPAEAAATGTPPDTTEPFVSVVISSAPESHGIGATPPASTPSPTSSPVDGNRSRITPGLVLLFVAGVFIALLMALIGLGMGFWMKRRDRG